MKKGAELREGNYCSDLNRRAALFSGFSDGLDYVEIGFSGLDIGVDAAGSAQRRFTNAGALGVRVRCEAAIYVIALDSISG
jgi:hypothetical protein